MSIHTLSQFNFIVYQFAMGLGDSALAFVANALIGGALVWWLVGPLALVAVVLAWLLDFCFSAMIGPAAFLAEEVSAFRWVYQKLIFILGGLLTPLDFFPEWLRVIALRLFALIPAAFVGAVPAQFVRQFDWTLLLQILAAASIFLALALVIFYRGLRRYESGSAIQVRM